MPTNKEFLAKKVELDDKQDKLTAGDNITINQNTNEISASYPDVVGATSSTAGTHGLVPAPATGDEDKFLKGDGTWGAVSAGSASLAGLTDVDLNSPTDGQALVYDAANQEWVNGEAGNTDYVELTQAEYDALTEEEKMNGTLYFITDGEGGGGSGGGGIGGLDWANKVTVTTTIIPPRGNITYTPLKSGVLIISGYGNNNDIPVGVSTSSSENFYALLAHQSWTSSEIIVNANEELTITNGTSAQTMGGFEVYFVPFLGGGSSSSSIHYSTDEQVIGTWIDGKTLYQKTYSFSDVTITGGGSAIIATLMQEIIVNGYGYIVEGATRYVIPDIAIRIKQESSSVKLTASTGSSWNISEGSLTIQYTKITD